MKLAMPVLQKWWRDREPRERQVLLTGAVVCALLLGWALVWHPLANADHSLRGRLSTQQQNLDFMRHAQGQIKALGVRDQHGNAQRKGQSLLALADSSARAARLGGQIKRIDPLDQKRVRIEFARVGFDVLAGWLQGLQRSYGIHAEDVSIDRVQGIGLVNAHITLQEP